MVIKALSIRWSWGLPTLEPSPLLEKALVFFLLNRIPDIALNILAWRKALIVRWWSLILLFCLTSRGRVFVRVNAKVVNSFVGLSFIMTGWTCGGTVSGGTTHGTPPIVAIRA